METIKNWFLKLVLRKRLVVVVDEEGHSYVRPVKLTDGKKAFVKIDDKKVGFLDNPLQKEGEFRKNVSAPGLVRWFDL